MLPNPSRLCFNAVGVGIIHIIYHSKMAATVKYGSTCENYFSDYTVISQINIRFSCLQKMLKYDPAERISAKEALDHPYFDSLDKSQF